MGKSEGGGWVEIILHLNWVLSFTQDVRGENNHAVQHIKSWHDEEKINMFKLIACDAIKYRQTPGSQTTGLSLYTYFQTNAIVKGAEKRS